MVNIPFRGSALQRVGLLLKGLLVLVLLAGCNSLPDSVSIPGITTPGTPTPNRTLIAIEQMLTQTASIPTVTRTPLPTQTPLPSPTATGTPEPPVEGQIGQSLAAKNVGLTVLSARFGSEMGDQQAAEGRTFLDLEVFIQNLAAGDERLLPYTPFYFTLTDDAGEQYSPYALPQEALETGLPPRLLGGDLLPGEAVRGHVAFEVPVEPGTLMLHYTPPADIAEEGLPPVFAVSLSQAQGSIPGSIPATGSPNVDSQAWLSDSLPGQDQEVQHSGMTLKIELARVAGSFGGLRANTGSRFMILDAVIRNDTRPQVPYNPQYFKVKDAQGYEYPPVIFPGDIMLQAGSLVQDQSVRGVVVFQIPAAVERVGVIYRPQVLAEEWDAFRIAINVPDQ